MPNKADSRTKTCSRSSCDHAMRARGLCSTHYNQTHQPDRHAAKATPCAICGTTILRPPSGTRQPACSTQCRRVIQYGPGLAEGGYSWATDAAHRARVAGARVLEVFDRVQVFERDGWTCYLCSRPVDTTASPFSPDSPTVDHVVPLSRGGEHSLANVRTACLGCNSSKQADLLGDTG